MFIVCRLSIYLSLTDVEYLVVKGSGAEYLVEMVAIGIGDEYLSEVVAGDEAHYLLHTLGIELVKDVIEQQEGRGLRTCTLQEVELRQFQGYDIGLVLSLRTLALHQMTVERKLQVVTMDTMQRIAHGKVFVAVSLDDLQQRTTLTMRDIGKPYPLLSTRDVFIILLEQRHQLIDKGTTLLKELLASLSHLLLPELYEERIESC